MPALAPQNAAPSTLADVLRQVIGAFQEMGNATPILVGRKYLEDFGVGAPPRVLFAPEPAGKVRGPVEMGSAASIVHSCDVFIRGAESGDDVGRFDKAYELADLVIGCLSVAASGRIEWGAYADSSPTDVDAYGAEVALRFTYARDVRHSPLRWALDPATADGSTATPRPPPGQAGTIDSVEVTVEPEEDED